MFIDSVNLFYNNFGYKNIPFMFPEADANAI